MKKLCEQLNIDTKIKSIPFDDLSECIEYSLKKDEYKFYLNSELIDVNDRFRIFNHKNKNYIVKKTNKIEGELEVKLAQKAEEILDGLKVNNYIIKIIKPTIYYINDNAYILTEYMGNSLQECGYSKHNKFSIELETIFDILNLFLNKGVLYRGFLPRNMVVNGNVIYLLDWEDAFFDLTVKNGINLLWKTNFLLNWSYFYDYEELEIQLNKYFVAFEQEPPLLKYEEKFKNIVNFEGEIIDLRKLILKTVIESEKSIKENTSDFIICPNDMAHLVSDLFNSDIDVLFDISSSVLRRKSENQYVELLKKLSMSIIDSYSNGMNIQKNTIRIILNLIETSSKDEINTDNILLTLFEKDDIKFSIRLKETLNKLMLDFNNVKFNDKIFTRVLNYIHSFK